MLDICSSDPGVPSPNGCDADTDGYGNACDGDFTQDGLTGLPDFGAFGGAFGATGAPGTIAEDMNCDGTVGLPDFGLFGINFGAGTPGPSGLSCAGTVPCSAP